MQNGPRLDTGWTWWMTVFVVLVWLLAVAATAWLYARTRRARRARLRGQSDAHRPALPPAEE
jgi:hypothetical protein